ncbi:MAG: hypothetical protein FWH28_06560 [Clostridiales bacterium]|nr:hypothetical protein [Clostridiales bacterium]
MISSRKTKLSALAGLILVFTSVVLFMRVFPEQSSLHWASLFFIVLGETLPVAGYIWLEDSQGLSMGPGLKVGIYSLFLVYGLAAVSMAVILLLFQAKAGLLATLEIVMVLAFGAIFLFAAAGGGDKSRNRENTMAAVAFMRSLEDEVFQMMQASGNRMYSGQLRQIDEAIRYSDYSGRTDIDPALFEKIRELKYVLQDEEKASVMSSSAQKKQVSLLTEDILRLLKSRNRELLNLKKARNLNNG